VFKNISHVKKWDVFVQCGWRNGERKVVGKRVGLVKVHTERGLVVMVGLW
jgi:hypothetical protein